MTTARVSCSCGKVECAATGKPIAAVACYCDDCQRGSGQLQALPGAAPVLAADGGTAYVLYRKDRFECVQGREWLQDMRLKASSPTRRVVAGCCNAAMYLDFAKGHWLSVYQGRIQGEVPAIQMRIQTRFAPHQGHSPGHSPGDVPAYRAFSPGLIAKLLLARVAMLVS